MRHLFIFMVVLATFFTGCQVVVEPEGPIVKKIDAPELSHLIINFSAYVKDRHHLYLEDSWAAYHDDIKRLCIRYSSQRLVTLKEARLLIVEVVEELLARLNNNSILSFELETYPFTANQLDIQINFESYFGHYVDPLYIGMVWLQAGCVHFYAFDRKNPNIDWDHHRFEPYFKSRELALIQKEADIPFIDKNTLPRKANTFIFDRYEPYRPHPPYSPRVNYPPISPELFPYNNAPTAVSAVPTALPTMPTMGGPIPASPYVAPRAVPILPNPSTPPILPNSPSVASDLPPYNPNIPADSRQTFYNPNFYSDLPPYNPKVPAY